MNDKFTDKVVAITGAGKGLGRAYALYFASRGAKIVVNNRVHAGEDSSSADGVVAEIVGNGGHAIAEYSDVEDPHSGDELLAEALNNFGRLDCLIANAGILDNKTFRKLELAEIRHVMNINFMGTVNAVHPVFRHMVDQQGGSIVVSASSAGLFGQFGLPAYSASKAALIGLMQALSLEGKGKNVCVNAIAPYATTNMTADHMPEQVAKLLDPDLVAPVVAHLASGKISGQTWLAGAGQVANAAIRTSTPENPSDWSVVGNAELDQGYADAVENFEAFVASATQDS